jgi:hypothetical protein
MRVIFVGRRRYVGLFFQQSIHSRKEKLFARNCHLLLLLLLLLFLLLLFNYIYIYIIIIF